MPWVKAFHLFFVVAWFAGLFYLPRLFVYHCEVADEPGRARFCTMERRLLTITTVGAAGTLALGAWLWLGLWGTPGPGWLHAKVSLVALLIAFHTWLWLEAGRLRRGGAARSKRFYKLVNELPGVLLIGVLILVEVKPQW